VGVGIDPLAPKRDYRYWSRIGACKNQSVKTRRNSPIGFPALFRISWWSVARKEFRNLARVTQKQASNVKAYIVAISPTGCTCL